MKYNRTDDTYISRITLGTAQLGMEYGIANTTGKPDEDTSHRILKLAINYGINAFDTASAYGDSEQIIGDFLKYQNIKDVEIITKIPKIKSMNNLSFQEIYDTVKKSVISSAMKLNLRQIPTCLLHSSEDMNAHDCNVTKSLVKLKEEGFVKRIGVSTYEPNQAREFLQMGEFDVIQIPLNLFDLRLIREGLLEELRKEGIIIFARSVFLQGLFFLDPFNLPNHLQLAKKPLLELRNLASDLKMSIQELAFVFVRDLPGITSTVIGVETPDQLLANIKLEESQSSSIKIEQILLDTFHGLPEKLINPAMWKTDI